MNKRILFFSAVLLSISLSAFSYINWKVNSLGEAQVSCNESYTDNSNMVYTVDPEPELIYKVGNRFIHIVTKETIDQAKSIFQILPEYAREKTRQRIASYKSVRVGVDYFNDIFETGKNEHLTKAQRQLIHSVDYTGHVIVQIKSLRENPICGNNKDDEIQYFMSVVPENQAKYLDGDEALISYLKENSKAIVSDIERDKVQPGKFDFIVTKEGKIDAVKLNYTSGYSSVDKVLIDLVKNIPGNWEPATNAKGEKVDQGLVFFFGDIGC